MNKYYDFKKLQKVLDEKREDDVITVGIEEDSDWTSETLTQEVINKKYVMGIDYSSWGTPIYYVNGGYPVHCYTKKEDEEKE